MSEATRAQDVLTGAGLLPREMPKNYTFDKVREILDSLAGAGAEDLRAAAAAARALALRGPLGAAIFVKHHLSGAHEAEVDRVDEGEEGARFGVLVYPEGEVVVASEHLPAGTDTGTRLRYDPAAGRYEEVGSRR